MKALRVVFWCYLLLVFVSLVSCALFPPPPDGQYVPGPPPPAVAEKMPVVPYPHAGWVDGYWAYSDGQWAWRGGHWEPIPYVDAIWVPGYWHHYGARGWGWIPGYWQSIPSIPVH